LWRWHLTLRGVKHIIAEVRLLKYIRRKFLQSKEIDFAELDQKMLFKQAKGLSENRDEQDDESDHGEGDLHELMRSYTYQEYQAFLEQYF
jgi:hypothetical protein